MVAIPQNGPEAEMEPDDGPANGNRRRKPDLEAMRRLQALVRLYVPEGVSLVDELLQQRRLEVAAENTKYPGDR
jgi:hypothetical protein